MSVLNMSSVRVLLDILDLLKMSVLYGDVFEAAQEVIIVQAVKVLTHLALCRNALHIKELSRTGFEPCSRFMVL